MCVTFSFDKGAPGYNGQKGDYGPKGNKGTKGTIGTMGYEGIEGTKVRRSGRMIIVVIRVPDSTGATLLKNHSA